MKKLLQLSFLGPALDKSRGYGGQFNIKSIDFELVLLIARSIGTENIIRIMVKASLNNFKGVFGPKL